MPARLDTGVIVVSETGEGRLVNRRRGSSSLSILHDSVRYVPRDRLETLRARSTDN